MQLNIQRVSVRMLEKYAPRTKKTAEEMKRLVRVVNLTFPQAKD